jgi:transposase-like protein
MIRNSTKFVSYKDLKQVCADLKAIYTAPSEETGRAELDKFAEKWDKKYPLIYASWDRHWNNLSEFFNKTVNLRKAAELFYTCYS